MTRPADARPQGRAAPPLDGFIAEVARQVSDLEIIVGEACRARYRDPFSVLEPNAAAPAAVRPKSVEAIQAIVRSANRFNVPLWPLSLGQNLGYGGAAAYDGASVILDLSRMNRILEVNAQDGFCLVEPGVSFVDLFQHIEQNRLPLWLSVPGYGLGSLVGNALERGVGNSPYGDHAAQICGMEVVLGDGDLVRTGLGALPGSGMWQRRSAGLGPRFDELFIQSSYGIVTKMGLWLMPAPEASLAIDIEVEDRDGIGPLVEALAPLKRSGVIQDAPVIGSFLRTAALRSTRTDWLADGTPLEPEVERRICAELKIGWWSATVRLYGLEEMLDVGLRRVEQAVGRLPGCRARVSRWRQGDPPGAAHRGVPTAEGLANSRWHGDQGAHVDFSVALPLSGTEANRQFRSVFEILRRAGLDYHAAFYLRERHILNVVQILFDRSDIEMCRRVDAAYRELIGDAASRGLGLYRCPLRFTSEAMTRFAFNDQAISRLGQRVKRALDPQQILSPGKDGLEPGRP